jgi:acylphosphatase
LTKVRAHIWVSGRVQGVYFRWETRKQANIFGVTGWVRNKPNGDVEAVFEGEPQAVEKVLNWCREGPEMAYVTGMELEWEPYQGEFHGFSVRG